MEILGLQYADENALEAHSEEDLQAAMDAFSHALSTLCLTLNARKTQVLFEPSHKTQERQELEITVEEQCLSSAEHFTYLGSCLSSKADLEAEIQVRLKSPSSTFGGLRTRVFDNRNIYTNTKTKV